MVDEADTIALRIVRDAVRLSYPETFEELVKECDGLFPAEIARAVRDLNLRSFPRSRLTDLSIVTPAQGPDRPKGELAVPHPLDFDWRFDEETAAALVTRARVATHPGDVVVACGTPTVYLAFSKQRHGRVVYLHDQNAERHNLRDSSGGGRVKSLDFAVDAPPNLDAAYAVADPPWYPEYNELFLWWSSTICAVGATVALALAPLHTRPTIEAEREQLWARARELGFDLRSLEKGALRYETPPFERSALLAAGVPVISDWRLGVLAILELVVRTNVDLPVFRRQSWRSARLDQTELRFRDEISDVFDPRLIRVVANDTLDSVSTRDERRGGVQVWSSLNRVYGCLNPLMCHAIAVAVSTEDDPVKAASRQVEAELSSIELVYVGETVRDIKYLAAVENEAITLQYRDR